MKIQLDYDTKTITLVNDVSLKEFFNKIKTLLPNWKEWNLNSQTIIGWANPISIPFYFSPYSLNPWWDYTTCDENGNPVTFEDASGIITDVKNAEITSGTYNLELN